MNHPADADPARHPEPVSAPRRPATESSAGFLEMWNALLPIGRDPATGGYRRYAWTDVDLTLREWFAAAADARGLSVTEDRAGNQWAWWGDPDADGPGVAVGSHLDSVPDGGAYDGPLGVMSAFAAVDALRGRGIQPRRPVAVVHFGDEEGARFGVACAGSRLLTGALPTDRALALRDADATSLADALHRAGRDPAALSADSAAVCRVATFVELHVEQGRALADLARPVAVGSAVWPHGRWRVDLPGEANHAGTTALDDRRDPMLGLAAVVQAARAAAVRHGSLATCGKVRVHPNGVNAIPSRAAVWLDARGADPMRVRSLVGDVAATAADFGGRLTEESWTDVTAFDPALVARLSALLDDAPVLPTGAGHDAGILAAAGVPSVMLFVRNPTGISHSPAEFAEPDDCLGGVDALATVLAGLVG
jgi:N-carbamoyl-L-amino-acid hydrolase